MSNVFPRNIAAELEVYWTYIGDTQGIGRIKQF